MPPHANRFIGLYDQQNENRIADWGGDELFTRMPRPRVVDDAPAPRFRPSLVLVDPPAEPAPAPAAAEPPPTTFTPHTPRFSSGPRFGSAGASATMCRGPVQPRRPDLGNRHEQTCLQGNSRLLQCPAASAESLSESGSGGPVWLGRIANA